jgi:tyrosyl-tRNA synthetase
LVASNGEGFRTIQQGGLTIEDAKVTDPKTRITAGDFTENALLIRKGKKTYHRVRIG